MMLGEYYVILLEQVMPLMMLGEFYVILIG